MTHSRLTALALSVAGCVFDAGTEENLVAIGGSWRFTERLDDVPNAVSCAASGTYTLAQTGAAFDGSYVQRGSCDTPTGRVDNSDSGAVSLGRVTGRTVRFNVPPYCEYEGSVSGAPSSRITGRGVCVLQDGARTLNFSGTWEAIR